MLKSRQETPVVANSTPIVNLALSVYPMSSKLMLYQVILRHVMSCHVMSVTALPLPRVISHRLPSIRYTTPTAPQYLFRASNHIISHHTTSNHIISYYIMLYRTSSHHTTTHRNASQLITSCSITSHYITSLTSTSLFCCTLSR